MEEVRNTTLTTKKTLKITLDYSNKDDKEILDFIEMTKKKQLDMKIGRPLDDNSIARLLLGSPNKSIAKCAEKAFNSTLNEEDKMKAIYESFKAENDSPEMSQIEFIMGPYRNLNDRKIQQLISSYIQ